ncbi:modin [Colletotrichum truncatum]|uniref:Modin n=1 Tax=Colletotrichum truncatum TaxID=5467 RepID=A0ACC3ZG72_COLTU|nr:modin [Colletotrichum truncatum]KAF6801979.1 modin [Colletotrichum truncatum]
MTTGMSEEQFNRTLQAINDNVNDDDNELYVAIAALVISLIALLASILQVAQQYYASAAGYSSCDEKAIGKWAAWRKRQLRPYEFRFEVQFEAPVIFLCPPKNDKGPVKNTPIYCIDGSRESLDNTKSDLQTEMQMKDQNKSDKEIHKQSVHTADNELASWVTLLSALQQMEHDSRAWQKSKYEEKTKPTQPPRASTQNTPQENIDQVLDEVKEHYTLAVAVQRKLRSWDTMPSNVKKPYATTTWCHIVEMLALLGVYWVEFDRTNDRYRGEGNGYTVTGTKVNDLGIMFTFQVHGRNRFEANRIIPIDEVKELCFGFVPTIYRSKSDGRRLKFPNEESRDLSTLNFASMDEIGEALVLIGCNTNTVNYFTAKSKTARVIHLFPIAFEIIGMLGRTLHIEKSAFRQLPNPTLFRWDKKNFSLNKLLDAYSFQLRRQFGFSKTPSSVIKVIWRHIVHLQSEIEKLPPTSERGNWLSLPLMDALHASLDDMDEVLTAKKKERPPIKKTYTTKSNLATMVSEKPAPPPQPEAAPKEQPGEARRRELVQDVLRSHIQAVLSGFNEKPTKPAQEASSGNQPVGTRTKSRFEAMDAAPPELRQDKLMEVYFKVVRRKVKNQAQKLTYADRRADEPQTPRGPAPAPTGFGLRPRRTGLSVRTALTEESDEESEEGSIMEEELLDIADDGAHINMLDPKLEVTHEDIWCTLVFRMICWLMLHDFHKNDVQEVSKSELLGSRLPVYIA